MGIFSLASAAEATKAQRGKCVPSYTARWGLQSPGAAPSQLLPQSTNPNGQLAHTPSSHWPPMLAVGKTVELTPASRDQHKKPDHMAAGGDVAPHGSWGYKEEEGEIKPLIGGKPAL